MIDPQEESSSLSRRDALRRGTVAAGLIWSAPVIRSIQLGDGNGSPAPQPSTTTDPESTTHELVGEFGPVEAEAGTCSEFAERFEFNADLGSLGISTIVVELCSQLVDISRLDIPSGSFMLSNPDGTLNGTLSGAMTRAGVGPTPWDVHVEIQIIGGTGSFEGATGGAVIDAVRQIGEGNLPPPTVTFVFDGTITGSITIP